MSAKVFLATLAGIIGLQTSVNGDTIARFTFETSIPAGSPGAGVWITNIAAEVGSGVASGFHSGASTYSSPAGNGSTRSFSSTAWAVNDFYQFAVGTQGFEDLSVSYDHVSSGTGPGRFAFSYSIDGLSFTTVGSVLTVLANSAPNAWSSGTPVSSTSFSFDLSAISEIDDSSIVYFRVTDVATTSANGGTVASGGTSRIDNFLVSGTAITPVPEPSTWALFGAGLLGLGLVVRRKSK